MVDRVLLSASLKNAEACIDLAVRHGLGIEVMAFAYAHVLDGDWRAALDRYKTMLKPVTGGITMHGPFMDMAAGSPDPQINAVCTARFRHAIRIAHELDARIVVLHANFIAAIHTDEYRKGWQQRNVAFWQPLAEYAQGLNVTLAVENMWEFDPDIIGDVLKAVDHPHLRACIDVGHAHLYSKVPFETWLERLAPYIVHAHLNNNDGVSDIHGGLALGACDYARLLPQLRALTPPPSMTLEMDNVADMEASLSFFQLAKSQRAVSDSALDNVTEK